MLNKSQVTALRLIGAHRRVNLYGNDRSGKTFVACVHLIRCAYQVPYLHGAIVAPYWIKIIREVLMQAARQFKGDPIIFGLEQLRFHNGSVIHIMDSRCPKILDGVHLSELVLDETTCKEATRRSRGRVITISEKPNHSADVTIPLVCKREIECPRCSNGLLINTHGNMYKCQVCGLEDKFV